MFIENCISVENPPTSVFKPRTVFPNFFPDVLFISFRITAATQIIMIKLRKTFFVRALENHRNGLKAIN